MPPEEFAQYQIKNEEAADGKASKKEPEGAWKVFFQVGVVQFFCWAAFLYMWTYTNGSIAETVWQTSDTASHAYQAAGNWVGVIFAVQAVGSVIWAVVLPMFKSPKTGLRAQFGDWRCGLRPCAILHQPVYAVCALLPDWFAHGQRCSLCRSHS
jgi:hypothetical protein